VSARRRRQAKGRSDGTSTERRDFGEEIDFKALGRHFEARRIALGMRPGEFAVFAGVSPARSNDGNSIRALELYGKPCLRTIVKVDAALGIDDETVRAISGLDLAAMRSEWEAWAAEAVPVEMSAAGGARARRDPGVGRRGDADVRPSRPLVAGARHLPAARRHFLRGALGLWRRRSRPDHAAQVTGDSRNFAAARRETAGNSPRIARLAARRQR
jgi:hypothetical protein